MLKRKLMPALWAFLLSLTCASLPVVAALWLLFQDGAQWP